MTTNVSIRMDEDLKKAMERTCEELGMNLTTAVTIFAKKMVRENRIPFDVSVDPFWSAENQAHLRKAIADLDAGRGKVHGLIEVKDDD